MTLNEFDHAYENAYDRIVTVSVTPFPPRSKAEWNSGADPRGHHIRAFRIGGGDQIAVTCVDTWAAEPDGREKGPFVGTPDAAYRWLNAVCRVRGTIRAYDYYGKAL